MNKFEKKLTRRAVPKLTSTSTKISKEGQLTRSWSVKPDEFFRIYNDQPLTLEISVNKENDKQRIVLYTDLTGASGEWGEVEFERISNTVFNISVMPVRCGIFQFKIKHSPDNGKTWYWDRVPFTKVIVDPKAARDLRLYTMIPTASGTIDNWKKTVIHARNLRCNMIHLLPLTAMDASESPYSAADLFDIDMSYVVSSSKKNAMDQFEEFIEFAKENKIGICVDLVLNHIGISSVIAKKKPEWIVPDKNEQDGLMRAGCWHMNSWIKWNDLARINYDHPEEKVRKELFSYMTSYALFWANYAAYTGGMVRFDNLHSSHQGFISLLIKSLRAEYPELIIQAEFFSDSNTLLRAASEYELNLLLANPWEHPFAEDLRDYILYLHKISPKLLFLNPLSTHDTGAPAQLYGAAEATVPRYFVLALMGTGQTGIVQGTEHAAREKTEFIGRNLSVQYPEQNRFTDAIQKINALHAKYPTFHLGGNICFVDGKHGAVLACIRDYCKESEKSQFLLMANLDIKNSYRLKLDLENIDDFKEAVQMIELFSGNKIKCTLADYEFEIPACGIKAFLIRASN